MAVYENLFGAYPWNRVGYVAVAFNSGLHGACYKYCYGQRIYHRRDLTYEDLYYHELAHMWFGNLMFAHQLKTCG